MTELSTPLSWLIGPISPIVASTAVSASSSGTPAATSAPKASSRISRVIGREVNSACLKSSLIDSLSCLLTLASPVSPIVKPGLAACAALTAARAGADSILRLGVVAGDLETEQGGVAVGGDLAAVARRVGALELLGVGHLLEAPLHVGDRGAEARVGRRLGVALDQD